MLRGLYTVATGMLHQARRLDAAGNNLANINTKGYKRDHVTSNAFRDQLLLSMGNQDSSPAVKPIGYLNHGVYAERVITYFEQGNIEDTSLPTDLALAGDGFFAIMTGEGERYTRDGSFIVDSEGMLVTSQGYALVGENGPVYVGTEDFTVDIEGNVIINGWVTNRLSIAAFADSDKLEKVGVNLFENVDPQNPRQPFEGEVLQGKLEDSNVNAIQETVDMITAARSYESSQRILQMIDDSLGKAVNEIARF